MSSVRHPIQPQLNPQVRTLSGSSARSSAFGATTQVVRLCTDTACFVAFGGATPTATTSSVYLPANVPQVFGVKPGDKLAAIGTSGNLYITEGLAV